MKNVRGKKKEEMRTLQKVAIIKEGFANSAIYNLLILRLCSM